MSEPLHVSDAEFESTVIESELPVLVDFWAPWCGPCRMLSPTIKALAKDYDGRLVFAKVNTDEHSKMAIQYGVQSIPALLLFKDGKLLDRTVGARPKGDLQDWIDQALETA
jgi:thioredoxin 1